MGDTAMIEDRKQSDKFKEAAREHGADEDEKRWEARLRKVATHRPEPEPHDPVVKKAAKPKPDKSQ